MATVFAIGSGEPQRDFDTPQLRRDHRASGYSKSSPQGHGKVIDLEVNHSSNTTGWRQGREAKLLTWGAPSFRLSSGLARALDVVSVRPHASAMRCVLVKKITEGTRNGACVGREQVEVGADGGGRTPLKGIRLHRVSTSSGGADGLEVYTR